MVPSPWLVFKWVMWDLPSPNSLSCLPLWWGPKSSIYTNGGCRGQGTSERGQPKYITQRAKAFATGVSSDQVSIEAMWFIKRIRRNSSGFVPAIRKVQSISWLIQECACQVVCSGSKAWIPASQLQTPNWNSVLKFLQPSIKYKILRPCNSLTMEFQTVPLGPLVYLAFVIDCPLHQKTQEYSG